MSKKNTRKKRKQTQSKQKISNQEIKNQIIKEDLKNDYLPEIHETTPVEVKKLETKKTNSKSKKLIICSIVSVVLVLLIVIGIKFYNTFGKINYTDFNNASTIAESELETEQENIKDLEVVEDMEIDTAEALESIPNISNILLIGEENSYNDERGRTDSMLILTIDKKNKEVKLTSLMRDTYIAIPGYSNNRINAAYTLGGVPLLKDTIETNYGIKIDNTILVDFEAFEDVIDVLGGIDIVLSQDEIDWMVEHNFQYKDERTLKVGKNHLEGYQALGYARIRYVTCKDGQQNDFGRTSRQREILQILFKEYKNCDLLELIELAEEICPYITTDLTQSEIMNYVIAVSSMDLEEIETFRLPIDGGYDNVSINGMSVLSLDWDENRDALKEFIYNIESEVNDNPDDVIK